MAKRGRTRILPLLIAGTGISALLLGQINISTRMHEKAFLMAAEEQEIQTDNDQKPKEAAGEIQQEGEKKAETAKFLADRHKEKGIACSGCHKEDPPAQETPTSVCLSCHSKVFAEGTKADGLKNEVDPHLSHMTGDQCGACHHAHKESEDLCISCHDFGYKIP
jgi:hypothetical protein